MPMQPPVHAPPMQAMHMPMTPQPLPIMAHPGFAPVYAPPAMIVPAQRPSPFGLFLFAAPLALATAALAALALLF